MTSIKSIVLLMIGLTDFFLKAKVRSPTIIDILYIVATSLRHASKKRILIDTKYFDISKKFKIFYIW
jgi:hypothetical protein